MHGVYGVIAEYNPFHGGHKFEFDMMRALGAEYIVVAESGHFVQRGEPAVIDKFARAEMALSSGADLVVEIPAIFSSSSAREFARAGVKLLHALGIVDCLSFGVEGGVTLSMLREAAAIGKEIEERDGERLSYLLKEGLSYPEAMARLRRERTRDLSHSEDICAETAENSGMGEAAEAAACRVPSAHESLCDINRGRNPAAGEPHEAADGEPHEATAAQPTADPSENDLFALPNNILALEYLGALEEISREPALPQANPPSAAAAMKPVPIGRNMSFASSSDIRVLLFGGEAEAAFDLMPPESAAVLRRELAAGRTVRPDDLCDILNERLLEAKYRGLCLDEFLDTTPDMARRLVDMAEIRMTFEEKALRLKTRQYTLSRARRALLHIALGMKKDEFEHLKRAGYIRYIRILGFRREAMERGLLRLVKENALLPIVTKPADHKELLLGDVYYDSVYHMISGGEPELARTPVIV